MEAKSEQEGGQSRARAGIARVEDVFMGFGHDEEMEEQLEGNPSKDAPFTFFKVGKIGPYLQVEEKQRWGKH